MMTERSSWDLGWLPFVIFRNPDQCLPAAATTDYRLSSDERSEQVPATPRPRVKTARYASFGPRPIPVWIGRSRWPAVSEATMWMS
jgi:hypothetical protein